MTVYFRSRMKGFTLVELVVVITVIGIILAASTISYKYAVRQAQDEKIKTNVEVIRISLELFRRNKASNNQFYPFSLSTVARAGYDVPLHPITNDVYGYNYMAQPTGCIIVGGCTSYKIEAPIDEGNAILYATPLESKIISEPSVTPSS